MDYYLIAKSAFSEVVSVLCGVNLLESDSSKLPFNSVKNWLDCTSLISMSGNKVSFFLSMSADLKFLAEIYQRMFGENLDEVNAEAGDLLGEICNQTAGRIKTNLSPSGYTFDMTTPVIVYGNQVKLRNISDISGIQFQFLNHPGSVNFFVSAQEIKIP